jgi:hypothetical protein
LSGSGLTLAVSKSSADAELSESINRMYRWYQDAAQCIVYLEDARNGKTSAETNEQLKYARWFKRDWALQELLASSVIYFFDIGWRFIGGDFSLGVVIAEITGIPAGMFTSPFHSKIADNIKLTSMESIYADNIRFPDVASLTAAEVVAATCVSLLAWPLMIAAALDAAKPLGHRMPLDNYSPQKRLSWARNRQTTRPEDRAYSLLGIFDVSIPMI